MREGAKTRGIVKRGKWEVLKYFNEVLLKNFIYRKKCYFFKF